MRFFFASAVLADGEPLHAVSRLFVGRTRSIFHMLWLFTQAVEKDGADLLSLQRVAALDVFEKEDFDGPVDLSRIQRDLGPNGLIGSKPLPGVLDEPFPRSGAYIGLMDIRLDQGGQFALVCVRADSPKEALKTIMQAVYQHKIPMIGIEGLMDAALYDDEAYRFKTPPSKLIQKLYKGADVAFSDPIRYGDVAHNIADSA